MAESSSRKKPIFIACLISFITVLLIFFLEQSDFFRTYELKSMDLFQRFHSPLENPEVLMVEINQQDLTSLSEKGIQWPWPRQIYAPLVEVCAKAGARGIIFDILFSVLGSLAVAAFSRRREFKADAGGARLAGRNNMIAALEKLQRTYSLGIDNSAPSMAAMKISGSPKWMQAFSSHPPLEVRIEALKKASVAA